MSALRPYLFWYLSGAVIAAELVVMLLMWLEVLGDAEAAKVAKTELDKQHKGLEQLYQRALNGSKDPGRLGTPVGVFDPENDTDSVNLTGKYLITPQWKRALEDQLRQYERQTQGIQDYLAGRSARLHQPILEGDNRLRWYEEYKAQTGDLLKRLHQRGCYQPAEAGTSPDFSIDPRLRQPFGFFTSDTTPDPREFPLLTIQFRTVEYVARLLLEAKQTNQPNPLAPDCPPPVEEGAVVLGLRWGGEPIGSGSPQGGADGTVELRGEVATVARARRLGLSLQGPLSALMAVEAAFEHGDPEGPVLVVTGVRLARKGQFTKGERKDAPHEIMAMTLNLLVLDFSRPAK